MTVALATSNSSKRLPEVITSFNEEGYRRYGKDFLESWLQYWSPRVKLTVYYEGDDFPFTSGMAWRPIEEVEFLTDYLANLRFPIMHGLVGDQQDMWLDARMGRKSFMQMHHMRKFGGKVFWIDADTVTQAHVPETLLDDMLPDDKFSCYLGREWWYHTESGFIGFNGNHPIAKDFAKVYLHQYLTGSIFGNYFFNRPGWNDCVAYDTTRHLLNQPECFVNISKDVPEGTMHPQVNTILGKYFTHMKGDRKDTKQLRDGDILIARG